jgi:hypothetical protein
MTYPLRLLPKQDFTVLGDADINPDHFLGKWVVTFEGIQNEDGKLDASAIDLKRIPGFSSNKIPESLASDLNIAFNEGYPAIYNAPWSEGATALLPDDGHFQILKNRTHYFIKISEINGFSGSYYNPPDDNRTIYNFTVNIVHKPLMANYWHFEIFISSPDHKIVSSDGKWRQLICSSIRDRIQEIAVFDLGDNISDPD